MKMTKIEKAQVRATYAQIFINFVRYYFSLKTKQQKDFSREEHMPDFLKISGL